MKEILVDIEHSNNSLEYKQAILIREFESNQKTIMEKIVSKNCRGSN